MTAIAAMPTVLEVGCTTICSAMQVAAQTESDSESFYSSLPVFDDFAEVARPQRYVDLPDDWHVLVADVQGSTAAVRAGRYKDVNLLGASSIISVLNATQPTQIPYIFGGDGATLCVPASKVNAARSALVATQRMARDEFMLELRAGVVPVRFVREAGYRVAVAKFRASENYTQASFTGGGVQYAERCVKDDQAGSSFHIDTNAMETARGDFSGLECRWNSIPSPHGEIVTLLVQATSGDLTQDADTYAEVIHAIDSIYGHAAGAAPVKESDLSLTLDRQELMGEARVQAAGKGKLLQSLYTWWAQWQSVVGRMLLAKGLKFGGIDWGKYRRDVIANTDYRKFDDVLRHVLSGTSHQREHLTAELEKQYRAGKLVYGLHHAPTALMTCLIFARDGGHVHFVDGADGGYTMASADLKQRLSCKLPQRD